MSSSQDLSNFIWQIADLLRGPYRPPQYERVMLPMTVLRRFDCVLDGPSKEAVVEEYERLRQRDASDDLIDRKLNALSGYRFHNHSQLTFEKLKGDPDRIAPNLAAYIAGFSQNVRDIFDKFDFLKEVETMAEANLLYLVVSEFAGVDLHPRTVPNPMMGTLFEDLIRRFNEQANETAGDHFTPRDVVSVMVDLLLSPDDGLLQTDGIIRTVLDPACGTGGLLSEVRNQVGKMNKTATLFLYGQDFNPRSYAIAASDFLMKEDHAERPKADIRFGDTLIHDQFKNRTFDYFLANPPFGVDWKRQRSQVKDEHETEGYDGRFGAGLPRVNDGALLFLQHMVHKFERPTEEDPDRGSRLAIVFSGSPLFSGGAGSGESEIRKWLIENDWLEAIVALPEQMFYNTGIGTYIWIVTNRKERERRKTIQLVDARDQWAPGGSETNKRSLGDKRRHITEEQAAEIVRVYGSRAQTDTSKVFESREFGYTRVTVERPLRLRFQITTDRKAAALDRYPDLLDDVQTVDDVLGREPYTDWNDVEHRIGALLKERGSRWRKSQWKAFRDAMTEADPEASPVVAEQKALRQGQTVSETDRNAGWHLVSDEGEPLPLGFDGPKKAARVRYEPDSDLRDTETVWFFRRDKEEPTPDDPDAFFRREVLPNVPDAWMDREKDRIGYEINFNRYFYAYTPPRPLHEIDADLAEVTRRIVDLLGEVA